MQNITLLGLDTFAVTQNDGYFKLRLWESMVIETTWLRKKGVTLLQGNAQNRLQAGALMHEVG
eukprot:1160077-Pelagomonas_calceolata.AAC.2